MAIAVGDKDRLFRPLIRHLVALISDTVRFVDADIVLRILSGILMVPQIENTILEVRQGLEDGTQDSLPRFVEWTEDAEKDCC